MSLSARHVPNITQPGVRCGCESCRALGPIEEEATVPKVFTWAVWIKP